MEELVSLVHCVASLSFIRAVVEYLDHEGSPLFRPLISFSVMAIKCVSHVANNWPFKLENATINLLCR